MNDIETLAYTDSKITDLEKTVEELQLNLKSKNDLVEELTMRMEKMKCCANCINGLYNGQGCAIGFKCENKNKWEVKR